VSAAPAHPDLSPRAAFVACALAVAFGAGLRLHGLGSDFWLDEAWTWSRARALAGAQGVFALHDSNNHHLNTLWFYALGEAPVWLYRLPAFLAGSASVALGAALAWRRGRLEAAIAAWLFATCFALVHFSSEARGYAPVMACALGAQLALEADLAAPRRRHAALFGLCAALGLLFQLIFVFYWAGAAAQALWRWRGLPLRTLAARLAARHALPLAVLAALYAADLRSLVVGGGNPTDLEMLLVRSVGWSLGPPILRGLALPDALLAAALVGSGLALRARRGDDSWLCFALCIALVPLAAFALLRPEVIAVRYFLIGIALALLLAADLAAAGWRARGARRALAAAALLAFFAGQAAHLRAFAVHGRGGFRAALMAMAEHTQGDAIEVGSDHDFRNGLVLAFYARELPPGRRLVYLPQERWPAGGPEWLIRHAAQRPKAPALRVAAGGGSYRLFAEYDHAAISGFYWALYRRETPGAGSGSGPAARTRMRVPKPAAPKGSGPNPAARR
jgi:hypothetical protein